MNSRNSQQEWEQQMQDDDMLMDDDDNAQIDQPDLEDEGDNFTEDPFQLALDDLEGRVVSSLDVVKVHPGHRTEFQFRTAQDELAALLQPLLEVAAHTSASIARTYTSGGGPEAVEATCEEAYNRVVSDLTLPVLLEMAQSDPVPSKRVACLEFFRKLFQEFRKPGSWLDQAYMNANAGPYGAGSFSSSTSKQQQLQRQPAAQLHRRRMKRLQREGEVLRYWVQASLACMGDGVFTAEAAEAVVASRGIIAASASIRPSLKHVSQRIQDADDRGASRVFNPTMKMVEGVLNRLFLSSRSGASSSASALPVESDQREGETSACIKFVEILCFCCASKPPDPSASRRSKGQPVTSDDFSLEDLPAGHPTITKESLESIAEYAFSTLRGLTLLGGQIQLDQSLLEDILNVESPTPTSRIVSMLKVAALPYLELEQTLPNSNDDGAALKISIDRSAFDFSFRMSQKSHAVAINALSSLAHNRPLFFGEAAICLARRCADPPVPPDSDGGMYNMMPRQAAIAIQSQLKASCLTLLRNSLSVQSGASSILHKVLAKCDMSIQADKALKMAEEANELKTAGRAARNRANMFYEWETSGAADERSEKRRKETDVALAKVRQARAARGLGNGIQLSHSMVDAIELVLANVSNLPEDRPKVRAGKVESSKTTIDGLESFMEVVLSNGSSLIEEEGRWFGRSGEKAWKTAFTDTNEPSYELNQSLLANSDTTGETKKEWNDQCLSAASAAFGRIATSGLVRKNTELRDFILPLAGRLAWTLKRVTPPQNLTIAQNAAAEIQKRYIEQTDSSDMKKAMTSLFEQMPVITSCLSLASTPSPWTENPVFKEDPQILSRAILSEAYLQSTCGKKEDNDISDPYDTSLELLVATVPYASSKSSTKPSDTALKHVADQLASTIHTELVLLPRLTSSSLSLLCSMCDIKAPPPSTGSIAAGASYHAVSHAIERRATAALLALRDSAFQHTDLDTRRAAVEAAVSLATGRFQCSTSSASKALKLVVNVMYPRSNVLAAEVTSASLRALKKAIEFAQDTYGDSLKEISQEDTFTGSIDPRNDDEKKAMDHVRKPLLLMVALCIKRSALIHELFDVCSDSNSDFVAKALRHDMQKLATPLGILHGPAEIAMAVAKSSTDQETPLLVSFLEALANQKKMGEEDLAELIQACHDIQALKLEGKEKPDTRYIIPVLFGMKRVELVSKLPGFVDAGNDVLMMALGKMASKLFSSNLLFRQEPDPESSTLKGMTLCEQLVYLHEMDFESSGLPQRRYLDAIRLCLENVGVFEDRVVMAALDQMSLAFVSGSAPLPLAFMRSCIVVSTKRESMHNWMCYTLLPRLVEGNVYEDKRQWEGWMRCAKMLQNEEGKGASSIGAIRKLPPEQLQIYQTRYGVVG